MENKDTQKWSIKENKLKMILNSLTSQQQKYILVVFALSCVIKLIINMLKIIL